MQKGTNRRIAVSRLRLKSGDILKNQIIEIADGKAVSVNPLTEELPNVEWHDVEIDAENLPDSLFYWETAFLCLSPKNQQELAGSKDAPQKNQQALKPTAWKLNW